MSLEGKANHEPVFRPLLIESLPATMNAWPSIRGSADLTLSAHANQPRKDINSPLSHSLKPTLHNEPAGNAVPYDVFQGLCHSVLDLLGKVENQPSLADLADAIKQIDQNHQDDIGGCKSWNEIP
jgi:hypothetical protein